MHKFGVQSADDALAQKPQAAMLDVNNDDDDCVRARRTQFHHSCTVPQADLMRAPFTFFSRLLETSAM